MTAQLHKYLLYNIWANKTLIPILSKLTDEQFNTIIPGSFDSIKKTVLHIWDAEAIWLQRLLMTEKLVIPSNTEQNDWMNLLNSWLESSTALSDKIKTYNTDEHLMHEVIYIDSKKQSHKSTIIDIAMHVVNHSTYHRGQVINFLRQVGVTTLPSTDFITYCRAKK